MKKVSLLLLAALFMLLPFAAMAQTDLAALENANSTIAIMGVPDNTTSSLVVYVMAGAEQVAAFRLCGDASGDDQKQIGKAVYNGDGSYTLKGVKLASGISVTLNLTGTQNLQNGVYLFHCDVSDIFPNGSQTFIGAGSASQTVDLSRWLLSYPAIPMLKWKRYAGRPIILLTLRTRRKNTATCPKRAIIRL